MKNSNQLHNICKTIGYSVIFFLISFNLISCDKSVNPRDDQDNNKNLLAFTAVFYDNKDDSYTAKLVVTDFYNPNDYTILTSTKIVEVGPVFSEDKSKIIFGILGPAEGGPQLVLYNLQTNQLDLLEGYESGSYVYGSHVVWDQDGTGFYFRGSYYAPHVYFYNFSDKLRSTIRHNVMPVALKDSETLIVYGINLETGQQYDYFLIDSNGNYIGRINNPYLEYINRNGVFIKGAYSLDYNAKSNQFVFSSVDSTVQGRKIAVTDFTGNYYKEYTKGDYIDDHPKWGPDGTILFDRRVIQGDFNIDTEYKIMKINIETGEVTEFLNPNVISGAIAIRYPEF